MKLKNEPYTTHPIPDYLVQHFNDNPDALNFQVKLEFIAQNSQNHRVIFPINGIKFSFKVIGGRGKGKSTMIKQLLNELNSELPDRPETGSSETTKIPSSYKIKEKLFLWDMPGLGGPEYFLV